MRVRRGLFARNGEQMVHYSDQQIAELILEAFAERKIALMAPHRQGTQGHYRELFETLTRKGYLYARIDGEIREFTPGMKLDRYKIHTIDLIVDRLTVSGEAANGARVVARRPCGRARGRWRSMTTARRGCATIRAT